MFLEIIEIGENLENAICMINIAVAFIATIIVIKATIVAFRRK